MVLEKGNSFMSNGSHEVYTPPLSGLGERSYLVSRDIGFDTHVLDIIRVLECENLSEVMLVGHSYGGFSYRRRGRKSS